MPPQTTGSKQPIQYADLVASLPAFDTYTADLAAFDAQTEGMDFPTGEPQFNAKTDPEVNPHIRLPSDLSLSRTPTRRLYVDYRSNPEAYKHLDHLPPLGGDTEMVISGKYAMFDLIPALIEKTGQGIQELTIATLSFSKPNAADLLQLFDDKHIKAISLLISYYFKSTSRDIYDLLIPQLRERNQKVLACRTHAKIILAKMDNGDCYSFRGSPNLRSSVNVETLTATHCPDLYAFHHQWIHSLLDEGKELGGS